jgi:hypothetical protein
VNLSRTALATLAAGVLAAPLLGGAAVGVAALVVASGAGGPGAGGPGADLQGAAAAERSLPAPRATAAVPRLTAEGFVGTVLARYEVDGSGELGVLRDGAPTPVDDRLWADAVTAFTSEQRSLVTELLVIEPGDDDMVGLARSDGGLDFWLALDGTESDLDERRDTLLHEFAHVLSMTAHEVEWFELGECPRYQPDGWACAREGSYLAEWVARFWARDLERWQDASTAAVESGPDAVETLAEQTYDADPEAFLTPYAATNPEEDFAVTFANWAMGWPATSRIVAAKHAYLKQQPELVAVRDRVRAADWW